MGKLGAVIRREFMERVRTKWFAIATIFGPLFFLGISVLPIWLASRDEGSRTAGNIVVIDATGAGLGARLLEAVGDSAGGRPVVVTVAPGGAAAAESTATADVRANRRVGYLVLDSATLSGERARYAGRNATTMTDMNRLGRAVDRAVLASRLEGTGLAQSRLDSLTSIDVRLVRDELTETGRKRGGGGRNLAGFFVAFLLYMILAVFGQNILRSVIEEKSTRVAEVVVASVKPETLLLGKVLGVGAVALTQVLVWGVSAALIGSRIVPLLVPSRPPGSGAAATQAARTGDILGGFAFEPAILLALLAFFLLGFVFFASCYAAVGAMVNSEQEAQQASLPVTMMLVASAVFMQPILLSPNGTMARVLTFVPFTAPVVMPLRLAATTVPAWEIAASLACVGVGCVGALWTAARIYRVGLLMYGKRPGFAEVARWIRYR
jgi:ABC-2 type transport system permease protein